MFRWVALVVGVLSPLACSSSSTVHDSSGAGSGGTTAGSGGSSETGGSGGGPETGGAAGGGAAVGGGAGSGGSSETGGAAGSGGAEGGTGGSSGGGGAAGSGGTGGSGGAVGCGAELLVDGGFDASPSPWALFSTTGQQVITHRSNAQLIALNVTPDSGEYLAWFGNVFNDASTLSQNVVLPAGVNTLTLSGRLRIATAEMRGEGDFDVARIQLVEGSVVRVEAAMWSNEDQASALTAFSTAVDVGAIAGRALTFRVLATTDSNLHTSFWFDSLSLRTCEP